MKIVEVEAIPLRVPLNQTVKFSTRTVKYRDYVAVRVHTDNGIMGNGYSWYLHSAPIIDFLLKDHVLGEDPFAVEKIWRKMYREIYRERKGAAIRALSAIDIAIWDIIGKALNKPIYKLLGGYNSEPCCYASGGYYREGKGIKGLVNEMIGYIDKGFNAVKMKIGAVPIYKDAERIKAVRDAVGSNVEIMVDANNAYGVKEAIKVGRILEKHDVTWFEEPVWPDNIEANAKVVSALDIPIASGELEYTKYGFRELIKNNAVDIVQPDATVCGGVTEFMKIAHMAAAWELPVAAHAEHEVHMSLVGAIENGYYVEYFHKETDITKEMLFIKQQFTPVNGCLKIPDKPGLGFELDENALKKYIVQRNQLKW